MGVGEVVNRTVHHNPLYHVGREIGQGDSLDVIGNEIADSYFGIWAREEKMSEKVHTGYAGFSRVRPIFIFITKNVPLLLREKRSCRKRPLQSFSEPPGPRDRRPFAKRRARARSASSCFSVGGAACGARVKEVRVFAVTLIALPFIRLAVGLSAFDKF